MSLPLTLPVIQNWSCHNCGGCCRQHQIEITAQERYRILNQKWDCEEWPGAGQPVVVEKGKLKKRFYLAHQTDGACVFLDERGLCRIHAKFGEAAKPLACRVYPYVFHPAGKKVTVSLRFSCPSVVSNLGKPLVQSREELNRIAKLVVPAGADKIAPPPIHGREGVDWPDFMQIVESLDGIIADQNRLLIERIHHALLVAELLGEARFEQIRGPRMREFLEIITAATREEPLPDVIAPRPAVAMQFRLLVAQYGRRDTTADPERGWRGRWELLLAALRFTRGKGSIPRLQECFGEASFSDLERSFGPLPTDVDEFLTRYLRVKLQGLHFCGPAYYGIPLVEGLQSLLLIIPSVFWLARWLAVGRKQSVWSADDLRQALSIADHHHGFSGAFGTPGFRRRVRMLAAQRDILRLSLWYSRSG